MTADNTSNKPKKEDILKDLLSAPSAKATPEIEALTSFIQKQSREPLEPEEDDNRDYSSRLRSGKVPIKKRTTCYLAKDIFKDLGKTKKKIREMVPPESKTSISKSLIVAQALRIILKEFEIKGENSVLVKRILSRIKKEKG